MQVQALREIKQVDRDFTELVTLAQTCISPLVVNQIQKFLLLLHQDTQGFHSRHFPDISRSSTPLHITLNQDQVVSPILHTSRTTNDRGEPWSLHWYQR